ncbi:MAG TPA: PP2C family serine/threonine-protein phosphatase [Cellvibrionaceae bacterium]
MSDAFYSSATDVGLFRDNNEDAIVCDGQLNLFLVADGMGGHEAGEVASAIAGDIVAKAISQGEPLSEAIQQSHRAILHAAEIGQGHKGMGSTIVALLSRGNQYQIAWVGDSRAYLWRSQPEGKSLQQLTVDHSYVQMLYQHGAITAAEMARHPEKNIITQCLGSTDLARVDVDEVSGHWQKNDWILLCSDGLTDAVTDQMLCDVLSLYQHPQEAVDALVKTALSQGGRDNISVVLVAKPPQSWKRWWPDCVNRLKARGFFKKRVQPEQI